MLTWEAGHILAIRPGGSSIFPRTTQDTEYMGQTRGQWGPQRQCPALLIQDQNPWLQPATGDRARLPAQLPPKCVLALGPEEVDVRLELQLEDVLLEDAVGLLGHTHAVAQQREAG